MIGGAVTRHQRRPGHRRLPPVLTASALVVSAVVLVPLAFLVVQAIQVGWAELRLSLIHI